FAALPMPETGGLGDKGTRGRRAARSIAPSLRRSVPLVANYEIVNLPSASTLAVLRRELKGRELAPKTLAVFADPVFEPEDERVPKDVRDRLARESQTPASGKEKPAEAALAVDELTRAIRDVGLDGERGGLRRLPYTRDEANAILAFAPAAGRFSAMDFEANQEAATGAELGQYRYVHFATHGLIDNQTPELSGLVLSQLDAQGRNQDGYLRMVEIYNLNLPAELVVLSACKTGLGKEVRGEGLMSLTRGFMFAGAARVVVSLWDVNDKSTASLMGELYRGLLERQLRPSAALREAQLKMLKSREWAAPYYWAAFVQHGEPR
ncbi:MAG: CHAT domain-containing protein, partial [Acidobacteriota bacterium]|nr:CHAT domain-containing protein [Acidobacteriota bacterium]